LEAPPEPLIVPAGFGMAGQLAPQLRAADAAECQANGRTPEQALERALRLSALSRAIVTPSGDIIALFGFAPIDPETAAPWLLGSDALVTTHRRWFVRNTQLIVRHGDHLWRRFYNLVDARNTKHIRWLSWAGFQLLPAVPNGVDALPFHPFTRTTSCVT